MALQNRAGPHLTHLLGPLQCDPRRPSSVLCLPCARVRTGWSSREGRMKWPHDWVQQVSLGDHKGRASILWPSVLGAHECYVLILPFEIPGSGGELEVKTPAPLWSQTAAPTGPTHHPPSHHISMLVVCVVVPSSSSGARYLQTEAPTSSPAVPGPPQGTANVCSPPTGHWPSWEPRRVDGRTADTTVPVQLWPRAQHWVTAAVTGQLLCASGQHWVLSRAYHLPL